MRFILKCTALNSILLTNKIADIKSEVYKQFDLIGLKDKIKPESQIGITCGSRGINNIDKIIKAAVDYVKDNGCKPFIIPAMGSHGGATAEGQKHVCEKFGVSEEAMGCPIRSSMETVVLGKTKSGVDVHFDKNAYESDGVIVVNRVKRHTDFTAKNESGIVKMLSVGLGKQKGSKRHAIQTALAKLYLKQPRLYWKKHLFWAVYA